MTAKRYLTYRANYDIGDKTGPYKFEDLESSDSILILPGGKAGLTVEGGLVVKMTNRTNMTCQKGWVVHPSTSSDNGFERCQPGELDTIGYVYDSVSAGSEAWIVTHGIAEAMLNGSCNRGDWINCFAPGVCSASAGPTGLGAIATATHFQECGHVLESHASGSNYTVKVAVHFL